MLGSGVYLVVVLVVVGGGGLLLYLAVQAEHGQRRVMDRPEAEAAARRDRHEGEESEGP